MKKKRKEAVPGWVKALVGVGAVGILILVVSVFYVIMLDGGDQPAPVVARPETQSPLGENTPATELDTASSALAKMTTGTRREQEAGLTWFTKNGPGPHDDRVPVAKALDKFVNRTSIPGPFGSSSTAADPVREKAIAALARWHTIDNVPSLIRVLEGQTRVKPETVQAAIEILAALKDPRALEAIERHVVEDQKSSGGFFSTSGPQTAVQARVNHGALEALRAFGRGAEPIVLKLANHPSEEVRQYAHTLLGEYGTSQSLILEQTLTDLSALETGTSRPDQGRRAEAARWLEKIQIINDPAAKSRVVRALYDVIHDQKSNGTARDAALLALLNWVEKEDAPRLITLAFEQSVLDGGTAYKELIDKIASFKDPAVAEDVATYLVKTPAGTPTTVGFGQPVNTPARQVQRVKDVLKAMGPVGQQAVIEYLFNENPQIRRDVAEMLRDYKTPPSMIMDRAVAELKNADAAMKTRVAEFLTNADVDESSVDKVAGALRPLLAAPETRNAALSAYSKWANQEVLPDLINVMKTTVPVRVGRDVRGNRQQHELAIVAVSRVESSSASNAIAELLANEVVRPKATQALISMGPFAEPAVSRHLSKNKNINVQIAVCQILRDIGTNRSAGDLRRMVSRNAPRDVNRTDWDTFKREAQSALQAIKAREGTP